MNILFINKFYWDKGGSEAVYFGEMELLKKHGHKVIPFSMQDERNHPSEYSKYFISNINYDTASKYDKLVSASRIIYSFEAKDKITKLLENVDIDIAHFHIFQHQISPSVFAPLRKAGIPIVLTLHDLKPMCPNYQMYTQGHTCEKCKGHRYYNCLLNSCTKGSRAKSLINTIEMYFHHIMGYYRNDVDRYIAVSNFFREKMAEFGFDKDNIEYIPNFIDTNRFIYNPSDEGYALFLGRLSSEKGVDRLLQACEKTPEIPVIIAGTGPKEDELKKIVKDKTLDNVTFVGFKSGDDLLKLITEASFTILPSQVYENCPMSILVLAVGTPVIGSKIGGIPELIEEGVDGYTFKASDPASLADKMKLLWNNSDKRKIMD